MIFMLHILQKIYYNVVFLALDLVLLLKLANRHSEMQQLSNFHESLVIIQIFNTKALLQMNI